MNDQCAHHPSNPEPGCSQDHLCPLSRVVAGSRVRIKQLSAPPEVSDRLRELGIREDEEIRLLSRQHNLICLVCNARLGLSAAVAEAIWVEPVGGRLESV